MQAKAKKKSNELLILASARGYYADVRPPGPQAAQARQTCS